MYKANNNSPCKTTNNTTEKTLTGTLQNTKPVAYTTTKPPVATKPAVTKITAAITCIVLLLTMTAACGGKEEADSLYTPPEFIYVAQSILIPDDFDYISNLSLSDDRIFFVANVNEYDEESRAHSYNSEIYTMNLDGTGLSILTGYKSPVVISDDINGGASIQNMRTDKNGNIWVYETFETSIFDLPDDFAPDNDDYWNYYKAIDSGNIIRKLDKTGAEIQTIDVSDLFSQGKSLYISRFDTDDDGNIYLIAEGGLGKQQTFYLRS